MKLFYKLLLFIPFILCKKYKTGNDTILYPLGFISNTYNTNSKIKIVQTPDKYDWRDLVYVPIRNQKNCGSCWAFATVSPLEYQYTYITKNHIHISEQSLISCNTHGYSCLRGGWWDYDDITNTGIILNDDYPYNATDEICKKISPITNFKVIKWGYINNNVEEMKSAIFQYGPIATGVSVDKEFYKYINGIYDHNSLEGVNHAVVLVGWDDSIKSWILRNSWGNSWGINGYMYIEYGKSSIGTNAVYVVTNLFTNEFQNIYTY